VLKTVKEANRSPPPFPFIFFKPVTTITDHNADVVIPKICQDDQADYEGELVCYENALQRDGD
jgi:2-keto-4-pentenoate hydratase/2-oxohepta-3-ene-1,7-dioic acid hydratase in catechol pathway